MKEFQASKSWKQWRGEEDGEKEVSVSLPLGAASGPVLLKNSWPAFTQQMGI